jgi:hypothetical protein
MKVDMMAVKGGLPNSFLFYDSMAIRIFLDRQT